MAQFLLIRQFQYVVVASIPESICFGFQSEHDLSPCGVEPARLPQGAEAQDGLPGTVLGPAHSGAFHPLLNQDAVARFYGSTPDRQSPLLHFRILHPLPVLSEELQHAANGLAGRVHAGQPLQGADHAVDPLLPVAQRVSQGFEASGSFWRAFAISAIDRRLEMLGRMPEIEHLQGVREGFREEAPHVPFLLL